MPQDVPQRERSIIPDWETDELTRDFVNPPTEVVRAMAELGRQPGATGYDEAGRLVRVRPDGSFEVLPDDEKAGEP
ncbi:MULTISPECIES: hypothetical protein [Xanthomonas]|uniref:Uncharacterized protein n=1 Tax=Xanthomonas campestris pv. glycines TaxID=473421 RepID=Q32XA0_XANCG|nr:MULTISPECIES: hypothetical protein [Xanthomonas]AAX12205.1 hypothetical protein [Xanthomonas citri pv. glycines]AAX12221.1 hypothetical protein [Xanthomonas citri pv. glycines]AOY65046.1 hypothetical protein BHE84_22880 [Xanthomonas citri pv. glycines str. 8ra]ARV25433.1 hypothetical protein A9D66_23235 [Xanthomonas citri pv. glycines str. 12-2]OOX02701.1 hypothetical protein Xgly_14980 [Xanthomonas citri pv. glycines]